MRSLPPHPNVLELVGACTRKTADAKCDELYLLMELCTGGSLAELLQRRALEGCTLSPSEVHSALRDMAAALAHLHGRAHPIAHRDVKPENFVRREGDGRWVLIDFGSATLRSFTYEAGMSSAEVGHEEDLVHMFSTPQYRAPEMCDLRRGVCCGVAVDVWALGVALYKMLFLRDLFGIAGEARSALPPPHSPPPGAPHKPPSLKRRVPGLSPQP